MTVSSISAPLSNAPRHATSHYFLEALNEVGIDYMFCNFGTDHAPIIEEVARWLKQGRRMPKIVVTPHENVAMHMAGGYAIATGRGQGVIVHVDAGTANAALGMHNLFRNRIPVLLMAGSAPYTSFGELTGSRDTYVHFIQQPMDQGSIVRPYSKWEYTLPSGVTVKETLRRAHSVMQSEPKGPVYLMLPRETLTEEWPEDAIHSFAADKFGPAAMAGADPALVRQLAEKLLVAKKPVLITSYAGRDPAASDAIEKLAAYAGIQVIDYLTVINIGRGSPYFGGFSTDALADADLALLVDVDVPCIPVATPNNPATYWAQIDVDLMKGASPIWSFPAQLRMQGRSSRILVQLLDILQESATPAFRKAADTRLASLETAKRDRTEKARVLASPKGSVGEINIHYFSAKLAEALADDDILLNEAVTRQAVLNMHIPRPKPGTMISNAGGGLGATGGMALGMKLACPERLVVQVVGDGTFYFNNPSAVLATSRQHKLPILMIVVDNSGWGAVKGAVTRVYPEGEASQQDQFQAVLAADTDFSKIAEAFGAYGEKVVDPDDVTGAIARAIGEVRGGRTALLHVMVTKL